MKVAATLFVGVWVSLVLIGIGFSVRRWWEERDTGASEWDRWKLLVPPRSEEEQRAAMGRR